MAKIAVRYVTGERDEWELTDAMDTADLWRILRDFKGVVGFAVKASQGGAADFGLVGLNMSQVAGWHMDGLVDVPSAAALWAEYEASEGEGPSTDSS